MSPTPSIWSGMAPISKANCYCPSISRPTLPPVSPPPPPEDFPNAQMLSSPAILIRMMFFAAFLHFPLPVRPLAQSVEVPTELDNDVEQQNGGPGPIIAQPSLTTTDCGCHFNGYPTWVGEVHGLSQALYGKSLLLRTFWRVLLTVCTVCGITTTILVIQEYLEGQTATSNTIRLVQSLSLPAITVCPKVPDAFHFERLYRDMQQIMPGLTKDLAKDLIKYWIGGSGLENMNDLSSFNQSYLEELDNLYKTWKLGNEPKEFFQTIQAKYGYTCQEFFKRCELGGQIQDCCSEIFQSKAVMRRGLCFQTKNGLNQTEADDIGRLVLEIKSLPSITAPHDKQQKQQQTIIYINDDFEHVLDFPRFYLYPDEWNRMHFTARRIELLEHPNDCTNKVSGKDSNCIVYNWLSSTVVERFNCTLPYLGDTVKGIPPQMRTCDPLPIAQNYTDVIQRVHSGSVHSQKKCLPGCKRWEYSVSLQQSPALETFANYSFNLEVSFYDLHYEHVKEVVTITFPGFMSQIGGQFGFFLGLSIITLIQLFFYAALYILHLFLQKSKWRRFDWLFDMFEIANKEREERVKREAEKRRRREGEGNSREAAETNARSLTSAAMRTVRRRRTKSEKGEESAQKKRTRMLTRQKSFDECVTQF